MAVRIRIPATLAAMILVAPLSVRAAEIVEFGELQTT